MRWLICTVLVLVSGFPSAAFGQFPLPPSPPSTNVPNCPVQLVGIVNGIHYWMTQTCTTPLATGLGQTDGPVPTGCNGTTCRSPINPLVSERELSKMALGMSPACSMTGDDAAKLEAIKNEVNDVEQRLRRLLRKPSEVSESRKDRIRTWLTYISSLKTYLAATGAGSDPTDVKIANYCGQVVPNFVQHRRVWSSSQMNVGSNAALIRDEQMSGTLVAADAVSFSAEPGAQIIQGTSGVAVCVEIPMIEPGTGQPGTAYFRVFTIRKASDPSVFTQIGVEVSGPGTLPLVRGRFTERNSFGHKIAAGGKAFLVVSNQDLSI